MIQDPVLVRILQTDFVRFGGFTAILRKSYKIRYDFHTILYDLVRSLSRIIQDLVRIIYDLKSGSFDLGGNKTRLTRDFDAFQAIKKVRVSFSLFK